MASLLVKVAGDGTSFRAAAARAFGAAAIEVEPILSVPPPTGAPSLAAAGATWMRVGAPDTTANPWDQAHALLQPGSAFAATGMPPIQAIEPDLAQQWATWPPSHGEDDLPVADNLQQFCKFDDQDPDGGQARGAAPAWNLGEAFSQLKAARDRTGDKQKAILIAHLDTGYDRDHITLPAGLRKDLQRNFMRGESPDDATDQVPEGKSLIRNRGHGTGTLSLLGGNRLDGATPGFSGYTDYLGGAPLAGIIPVRIANFVARFTTGTMVQGIEYARQHAHVLSMSMGGLSSRALVDAVNLAYDSGLVMVTAAGNNFAAVPMPKSIVFPARFKRVLAACGVMADGRAYAGLSIGTMQGNYGPREKMATALGAYTPNVPWAQISCGKIVDMNGAGTSAATPQIAAAAALWLAEYWDIVKGYQHPWMRVEAVRDALFSSAAKSTPRMDTDERFEKIGQGVLRAAEALKVKARTNDQALLALSALDPAQPSWSWLNAIFGGGVSLAPVDRHRQAMFALELTQMAQRVAQVDEAILGPERDPDTISAAERNRYLEAALDAGNPSAPLRAALEAQLGRKSTVTAALTPMPAPIRRKIASPDPPPRRLRVYALDPSLAKRLDTVDINEATISLLWDDQPITDAPLKPGPVGEYLEVVDIDPASGKIYEPVDLNDKMLLAQNGLPPSEGNPKFHQQMVYAVAMLTIRHFEEALGRKALWAPRYVMDDKGQLRGFEVPRLRLYPHALRTANAYYSPDKKALLFGYFPADSTAGATTTAGTMVFSCLSSDIIAHEMSHALLDGLHRRFQDASNPDVPAFHEAFADIVALFQHFTIPELVRFEISRARGDLSAAQLLAGLARQFGEGTRTGGALREYLGPSTTKFRYAETLEPHDRGAILVGAIYDTFRAIVARRTADLIRLAGGGGASNGAPHPDLVDRLTEETSRAAREVLRICIRALDYCPPVDITFSDYLRALVTTDLDVTAEDRFGFRIAFMEAFRDRGIQIDGVRTISTESLSWNPPENDRPDWLAPVFKDVVLDTDRRHTRSELFELNKSNGWKVWTALDKAFSKDPGLCAQFGLKVGVPRYRRDGTPNPEQRPGAPTTFDVFSVRPARRLLPDGTSRVDIIVVATQRRRVPIDPSLPDDALVPPAESFWFRGGATLLLDPNQGHPRIRYSIVKSSESRDRIAIQRAMLTGSHLSPTRALYFGEASHEPFAVMHADQRGEYHE